IGRSSITIGQFRNRGVCGCQEKACEATRKPGGVETMKTFLLSIVWLSLFVALVFTARGIRQESLFDQAPDSDATWYFAVSGDSRDCGDLIMPKIAQS